MQAEMIPGVLAAILDSTDEAIITKGLDRVITSWNSVAETIFGYSADEAIGMHIGAIIPADRLEEENAILKQIHRGERVSRYETVRLRKDGSRIEISLTVAPIKNAEGNVVGALKIVRDITELKKAELAVEEANRLSTQFEQVAECVPGVVSSFRMWPDGRACMPFATKRVEDLYGIAAAELAVDFSPVYSRVVSDDREMMIESVRESYRNCSEWHSKFRYDHPSKGVRWIEGWSRPQVDPGGGILWHGFLMDVSEAEDAKQASAPSRLNLGVESLQFHPCFVDGELPIDPSLLLVDAG